MPPPQPTQDTKHEPESFTPAHNIIRPTGMVGRCLDHHRRAIPDPDVDVGPDVTHRMTYLLDILLCMNYV